MESTTGERPSVRAARLGIRPADLPTERSAGKRYYEGQQVIDRIEALAVQRATALFGCDHANVQPYSGSPANLAVYLAFLEPGDTVLGMSVPMGGHLTHGWGVSVTGRWFRSVQYGVRRETGRIDQGVEATRREDATALDRIAGAVKELTSTFPAPGIAV